MDAQTLALVSAEDLLKQLHRYGVWGQQRDFEDFVDVNRSALDALNRSRGFVLEREWV
jgi:hypothetical protein